MLLLRYIDTSGNPFDNNQGKQPAQDLAQGQVQTGEPGQSTQPQQTVQGQPTQAQTQGQQQRGTAQVGRAAAQPSQPQPQTQPTPMPSPAVQPQPQTGRPLDMAPIRQVQQVHCKQAQDMQGKPAGVKEQEFLSSAGDTEKVPIVEMKEPGELPVEVEGWIERVERDDVAEPPTVVHQGKPIVSPAQPQQVSVSLPLDDQAIKKGLQHKFVESVRWLAEWCVRLIKQGQETVLRKK